MGMYNIGTFFIRILARLIDILAKLGYDNNK